MALISKASQIWVQRSDFSFFGEQTKFIIKGGFISESILTLVTLPTKGAKSCPWAKNSNFLAFSLNNLFKFSAQVWDLAHFVGQSQNIFWDYATFINKCYQMNLWAKICIKCVNFGYLTPAPKLRSHYDRCSHCFDQCLEILWYVAWRKRSYLKIFVP